MYNELRDEVHLNAIKKGFHDEVNIQRDLALVSGELGELIGADSKGLIARIDLFRLAMREGNEVKRAQAFKTFIKDSTGDELADVFLRLLDYAGHKEADLDGASEIYNKSTDEYTKDKFLLINEIFGVVHRIAMREAEDDFKQFECGVWIIGAIKSVEALALLMSVDLAFHVEQKMLYNAGREFKHGKKY